jgi:hypothetical protein
MKAKMTMSGDIELVAQLRYLAQKVPENARKVMHREANNIVKEARLNAPVDDAELEDAIHIEKGYESRGRLTIDVVVGGIVRGVDVDRYAMLIHENYESMTPGPGTIAKRAANPGRYVGGKFLERAVDDRMPKLEKAMIAGVLKDMEVLQS